MNNEPVAWMNQTLDGERYLDWKENDVENPIPLYTHPADESFDRTASHMAGEYVSYSENASAQHWKEQAKIYKDELLKAYKLFSNMHKNATESWDSLDLSGQSDLESARAWFFEGFSHGNTAQAKTLTDEEIVYLAKRFEGVWSGEVDYKGFARAILRKAQEK